MGAIPVGLLSALSSDLQREVGWSYDQLRALPALLPDFDHRLASAFSLARALTKKFLPSDSSSQDEACMSKFLECNSRSEKWSLRLNTSLDEELWGTFKAYVHDFFNPGGMPLVDSLDSAFLKGKVGPGASIGSANGDFYTKIFASAQTCTSVGLAFHYQTNVYRWPEWVNGETIRQLHYSIPKIVQGSRLSFVPKNDTISRSICTEPTLNMFYQLGVGALITERLRSYFTIDLTTQPELNAMCARLGSMFGSWSTIDLESASDSISMGLCREVIPRDAFSYLALLRSPSTTFKGTVYPLHMVSSMGNGFTFPLQTCLFAAMVKAAYTSFGIREQINVFGDDIVVRPIIYSRLLRLLHLAGFKVNADKSFNEGPFRESCGHDYFLGKEIRGVYMKRFSSLQDSYALINALNDFSAKTGINLASVMNWLRKRVDLSVEIPLWEDPASGIRTPLSMVKTRRVSETTHGQVYSKYLFKPRYARVGGKIRGKRIPYNPSGLLVAFLSGMALSAGLPLRGEGLWKLKKHLSCSYWDNLGSNSVLLEQRFDFTQFESAYRANLIG